MTTEIDGIAATEQKDVSGETLSIKGCDISELEAGRGFLNDNHLNTLPNRLGRITSAKKIFGPEDCEDERQRYYWNKVKSPYVYFKGRLYDADGDHRSAKAAAAILRHQHREDAELKLRASVEGGVIKRGDKDSTRLERTKLTGVALTFTPCNNSTLIEGLNLTKSTTWEADAPLIKSLIPFAKTDVPSFIEVADAMSEAKVRRNVEKIAELAKALTAGFGGGTPTEATGGQVLQTESIDTKSGNGFRYIECPSCGKDQPYAKFQVKCRSCGKAFPMDTLAKFFMEK